MRITEIFTNADNVWYCGEFVNRNVPYSFEGKVFEQPSNYGIKGGHVSKLWVKNIINDRVVFSYDRGLDVGTEDMIESGMIAELIYILTNYATTGHMYKVGDRVKIVADPPKGSGFTIYQGDPHDVEMGKWLDTIMTIKEVHQNCYIMREDRGKWAWTPSLIDSLVSK